MTRHEFAQTFREIAAIDMAKPRRWRLCAPRAYRPSVHRRPALQHGPTSFRWWLPVVVRVYASRTWGVQWRGCWNVWIYTRWNFNCCVGVRSCFTLTEP